MDSAHRGGVIADLAKTGLALDIQFDSARVPRATLIFMPCSLGDAMSRLYSVPTASLNAAGISTILYNPRGHGRSAGHFSFPDAVADFHQWLETNLPNYGELPLIGVGHSIGAALLLLLASRRMQFAKLFLVSPLLDTRLSVLTMYEQRHGDALVDLIAGSESADSIIRQILGTPDWMDLEIWRSRKFGTVLDRPSRGHGRVFIESVARYLENMFLPGKIVVEELGRAREICEIFLPVEDIWFPIEATEQAADRHEIQVTRYPDVKDHLFSTAWPGVWNRIREDLVRHYGGSVERESPKTSFSQVGQHVGTQYNAQNIYITMQAQRPAEKPAAAELSPYNLQRVPMPSDPNLFVGRDDQLAALDDAIEVHRVQIVEIVSDGGVGKSTLVWHWLERLRRRGYPGLAQAFGWSFYSQGQHEYVTDSQRFFDEAIEHFSAFGLTIAPDERKRVNYVARAIASTFLRVGGILVLDGVEPLQHPPAGINDGRLRDLGLSALLAQIRVAPTSRAAEAIRLVIVTTRWELPELRSSEGSGLVKIDLGMLTAEHSADLLENFRLPQFPKRKLFFKSPKGDAVSQELVRREFMAAARDVRGHALALVLLGSLLLRQYDGNLAARKTMELASQLRSDDPYRHARRIMQSYDAMFRDDSSPLSRACRQVLLIIGLFERPAPLELIFALLKGKPIEGLTNELDRSLFQDAVLELQGLRLLLPTAASDEYLDAHPLVREEFGRLLREEAPEAGRLAHERIFEHLLENAIPLPETLIGMEPLFQAIAHGCKAGRFRDALTQVYLPRVMRGDEHYAVHQLGALGSLISALSHFFDGGQWGRFPPKTTIVNPLSDAEQLTVLIHAGSALTAAKGYASDDVEACYSRAEELCSRLGPSRDSFWVGFGKWRHVLGLGKLVDARKTAHQLLLVAEQLQDKLLLLSALRAMTTSFYYGGDFTTSMTHALDAVDHIDPDESQSDVFLGIVESGANSLSFLALNHWHNENRSAALEASARALDRARRLNHSHTLAVTLWLNTCLAHFLEDIDECARSADELVALAAEESFPFWLAGGRILRGWCFAKRQQFDEAIVDLAEGADAWKRTGARVMEPYWLGLQAEVRSLLGDHYTATQLFDKADAVAACNGEYWERPELLRFRAEALLRRNPGAVAATVDTLQKAIGHAQSQGSKAFAARAQRSMANITRETS